MRLKGSPGQLSLLGYALEQPEEPVKLTKDKPAKKETEGAAVGQVIKVDGKCGTVQQVEAKGHLLICEVQGQSVTLLRGSIEENKPPSQSVRSKRRKSGENQSTTVMQGLQAALDIEVERVKLLERELRGLVQAIELSEHPCPSLLRRSQRVKRLLE